ncbi:hypothetical protein Hanom_Chr01g00065231 [Helianthus anomalus]
MDLRSVVLDKAITSSFPGVFLYSHPKAILLDYTESAEFLSLSASTTPTSLSYLSYFI